ncbi:YheC/YheD family protein [Aquibacillus salsiterrae]|uniref:YheC/YheD family protein n=1 Tax=Aquibacillus salsiterrae TaxID=2950439 RepID=A0A9X3WCH2_9BACI|nr:YheC/YheD family protein [Aquibacillus salsiterrae]MDC3417287.1 YheC/YheD family protein [Aquibacillus salsiterrae]
MTTLTLQLKFYPGTQNRMIVPQKYYKQLKSIQTIKYGINQSYVECLSHHKDTQTLYISSNLKAKLNLAKHKTITMEFDQNMCTLLLYLGVFIAGFHSEQSLLGSRTDLFRRMSIIGNKLGFRTLFFGHQHILSNESKVYAYYWNGFKWDQAVFHIPSVVYNRIPNRKTEHHPNVMASKKEIESRAILFNHDFFNKWEIYERLMKNNDCSYLLPETILHPSKRKIIDLLEKGPIYIKPIHGSRGTGIVKCTKRESGEIECHYYHRDHAQINRYTNPNSLFHQLFPNGLKGFVVQKEIDLLKKDNSAIDFRIHVNKNEKNTWEVTLLCAKFAGKGSLTTHVQRGGSIHTIDELFSPEKTKRIEEKLSKTALKLSQAIDKEVNNPIGEIGFDLGIDAEGKVWLFEANAKPGFSVFLHPTLNEQAEKVFTFPYKYAFYLHNLRMNKKDYE